MNIVLSQIAIIFAAVIVFPLLGSSFFYKIYGKERLAILTNNIVLLQFICIAYAFISLAIAYLESDFSVLNVVRNSHLAVPILYKFTGIWSNHEGSMLLWLFCLSTLSLYMNLEQKDNSHKIILSLITSCIISSIIIYTVLKSNPFVKLMPIPKQGLGFNPLLQDIALAIHPPILYLGYTACSIYGAIALSMLLMQKTTPELLLKLKAWALFSWSFLSLGIVLGSWWAYRELGWGGYWFWDPVENASLLPWLLTSTLIHVIFVAEKSASNYKFMLIIAILGFLSSILSTFLVRSGIVTSVHSFASDPSRGNFILGLLLIYSIIFLGIFAFNAKYFNGSIKSNNSLIKKLKIANILWFFAFLIILLSLIYPLLRENITGENIAIEANFFITCFLPILLAIILILAIAAPFGLSKEKSSKTTLGFNLVGTIIFSIVFYFSSFNQPTLISLCSFAFGSFLILRMICDCSYKKLISSRKYLALWLIHFLVGLIIINLAITESNSRDKLFNLREGEQINFLNFKIKFAEQKNLARDNYLAGRIILEIKQKQNLIAKLIPEVRYYPVEKSQTSESSIYHNIFYDLMAVISEISPDGTILIHLYFKPLMSYFWFFSVMIFILAFSLNIIQSRKINEKQL